VFCQLLAFFFAQIILATAMAALRWGICSAGKISHDFLVGLEALPAEEHKAVAVAARSKESAAKLAETHGISQYYGSYAELAADPNVS